jgi:hypothetical protein
MSASPLAGLIIDGLIFRFGKLIILYNKFRKAAEENRRNIGGPACPGEACSARRQHPTDRHRQSKRITVKSRWLIDLMVRNRTGEKVATGAAFVEFPPQF